MAIQLISVAMFLPLAGFLINGLLGSRLRNEKLIGIIGSGAVGVSFLIACALFVEMLGAPAEERLHVVRLFTWIAAGPLTTSFSYQIDQLSVLMMLVVTGVGFLIHFYSIGYMHGDPGFSRFFAYLNLFIFAMLHLVMADNFLLMFLGWEGVGLCSYLLIGFWYDRKFEKGTTGDAAKKAFIVNRIGDFGFLIAIFLLATHFGTLQFTEVFNHVSAFQSGAPLMVAIALALFLGATGKSAQIPLFVWLPDAMAGPTPVSALIHAATMVTAGVYMVARCSLIFALAPAAMTVVAVTGAATAIFAASVGLVQNDIKKVLAYSTISQLGYMFLAMGVGAFSAGMFHVFTHAFFKALLFLGSGAVIHAMHEEQDIRHMGGLRSALPVTYRTFVVGAIAIAGIPPFAGFFSKDEILWRAFSGGHWILWFIGLCGAALTAFYMFRLVRLTFEGEKRWEGKAHPHEAPPAMTVPLIILAVLSLVGGFVGIPASLGGNDAFGRWLEPIFSRAQGRLLEAGVEDHLLEYGLMALSVAVAAGGIFLARRWYVGAGEIPHRLAEKFKGVYKVLNGKYFVDELYDTIIVRPIARGSEKLLWKGMDVGVIDWCVNAFARSVSAVGRFVRVVQTGVAQTYAVGFLLGVVIIIAWLLAK
jgi:NADH-quinone oxidoreductase subunit L